MKEPKFRAWHHKENKMYYRGYQKLFHVLLCEEDPADQDGNGRPVKRIGYNDCYLLESTELKDKDGVEIFEDDILIVRSGNKIFKDVVDSVPDTFGAGKIHPLRALLKKYGIVDYSEKLELKVIGNVWEHPDLLEKQSKP